MIYYDGDTSADITNDCNIQLTASPTCTATALVGTDNDSGNNLNTRIATLDASLVSFTSSLLDFTAIDVTDLDLTD